MCLPKLTLRLAFHTCSCKVWPTCPSVRVLQEDMCKSTCELHRRSVLSTHPTWPSRMDRQRGFLRRVLSSLWTQASSTLPTAAWVKYVFWSKLFVSVFGIYYLPADHSRTASLALHLIHPFQFERFATVVVALFVIDNFENTHLPFLLSVLRSTTSGQSICRRLSICLQALWGNAKCSSPTLIAPSEII